MLEDMKSLRQEMQLMKKASKAEVDQTSASTSKAGPTKQSVKLSNSYNQLNPQTSDHLDGQQPIETDFCGPSLPPRFGQSAQSKHGSDPSDHYSEPSEQPERVCSSSAENTRTKRNTKFGQNTSHSLHLQRRISPLSY